MRLGSSWVFGVGLSCALGLGWVLGLWGEDGAEVLGAGVGAVAVEPEPAVDAVVLPGFGDGDCSALVLAGGDVGMEVGGVAGFVVEGQADLIAGVEGGLEVPMEQELVVEGDALDIGEQREVTPGEEELGIDDLCHGAYGLHGGAEVNAGCLVDLRGMVCHIFKAVSNCLFQRALECHEGGQFAAVLLLLEGASVVIVLRHGTDTIDAFPGVEDYGSYFAAWCV